MTKAEILRLAEEEDVEFIRLQFTDMFGVLKNVAVPASQLERAVNNECSFDGYGMDGIWNRSEGDLFLHPDLDTFRILPWRPQQGKVARMLCDVRREDGSSLPVSTRAMLKRVLQKADEMGYEVYVHPECEFFLFHTDENGVPTTVSHERAGFLDVSPLDLGENARREMVLALESMGFEIESSFHESAPAQHEIDFKPAGALEIADKIVTFKNAVRSTAKRFGLHATFMPKPTAGSAGSGMHISFTLRKDGKNIFFDSQDKDGISSEARWFMGGVMAHVKGMCALTNPLVNSYKRLTSGFEAPRDIIWTTRNQNTLIRVHTQRGTDVGIELRFPDPSSNPYLALTACIAAGLDGIEKRTDPGAAAAYNFSERTEAEKTAAGVERLPATLPEAVACLEQDAFLKTVLGGEFVQTYVDCKKAEWNEYMSQVSEWEIEKYLYRV